MTDKKLTIEKALTETDKMWTWLSKHNVMCKYEYFNSHNIKWPNNGCYLCQYTYENFQFEGCSNCPLFGKWSDSGADHCCNVNSYYAKWEEIISSSCPDFELAKIYAKKISETCKTLLKEIKN